MFWALSGDTTYHILRSELGMTIGRGADEVSLGKIEREWTCNQANVKSDGVFKNSKGGERVSGNGDGMKEKSGRGRGEVRSTASLCMFHARLRPPLAEEWNAPHEMPWRPPFFQLQH
jgi:hypothetical protein